MTLTRLAERFAELRETDMPIHPRLAERIAKIARANEPAVVTELALRRNAKFGKLNLDHSFPLEALIQRSLDNGDPRVRFARHFERRIML
jgi:hypothetical protein